MGELRKPDGTGSSGQALHLSAHHKQLIHQGVPPEDAEHRTQELSESYGWKWDVRVLLRGLAQDALRMLDARTREPILKGPAKLPDRYYKVEIMGKLRVRVYANGDITASLWEVAEPPP